VELARRAEAYMALAERMKEASIADDNQDTGNSTRLPRTTAPGQAEQRAAHKAKERAAVKKYKIMRCVFLLIEVIMHCHIGLGGPLYGHFGCH
jgi:hypothetical protein